MHASVALVMTANANPYINKFLRFRITITRTTMTLA